MIYVSAPGRAGIVGNPSDIYGGTVISSAIGERAEVYLRENSRLIFDTGGHMAAIDGPESLQFGGSLPYLDIARAVWRYLTGDDSRYMDGIDIDPGATFHLRAKTTIPMKAGCAGSTAMLAAILAAILAHFGSRPDRYHLAEMSRHIERTVLGVDCGFQDQYMAVFGGLNFMNFADKATGWERDDAPYASVEALSSSVPDRSKLPFVLVNTGRREGTSGTYHRSPRERWEAGEEKFVRGFEQIAQLAEEGRDALLKHDWKRLGELMNENYRLRVDLFGTTEVIDGIIKAALKHGALGAKLSGAGNGGTCIIIHEDSRYLVEKMMGREIDRIIPIDPHQEGLQLEEY